MNGGDKVFKVKIGEEVPLGSDHVLIIDRVRMKLRFTWFYIKEVKGGVKISHVRELSNDQVMWFGDTITLEGKSLEALLSYFASRPGSK